MVEPNPTAPGEAELPGPTPALSSDPAPPVWRRRGPTLAAVWLLSAAYLLVLVDRGWIPCDEGLLGQTAERVLGGELPRVDFDDLYTGGLAMWNALALRLLGLDLLSIRWFLYLAALIFVPLVYGIASRVASPAGAGAMTLLAVVWSVPNYFAGMPSWYNLFFAAGGVLALIRHVESGRRRWVVAAGLCGGGSFLIKSAGLLFIAAVLLFLLYREQEIDAAGASRGEPDRRGIFAFRLLITAGLVAFVAILCGFVAQRPRPMEILHHVVPGTALAILLAWRAWCRPSGPVAGRLRWLAAHGLLFVAGLSIPIALFLWPYARRGVAAEWATSGFLFQESRLEFGVWALPGPATLVCALPLVLLFAWPFLAREGRAATGSGAGGTILVGTVGLVAALLLAGASRPHVYQTIWFSLRPLVPVTAIVGALVLGRAGSRPGGQRLFLLLATASLTAIVQFPYARAIYFCYVAPLVALAWLFLVRQQPAAPLRLHAIVGAFYGVFALLWLNLGWIETMERQFLPFQHDTEAGLERADLKVTADSAARYRTLVALVDRLTDPGDPIFAGPDTPEVYFLTARRNPTRTLLDFLDPDFGTAARTDRRLWVLDEHAIDVVVLRRFRLFTPLDEDFAAAVERRYPHAVEIWPYSVHWRASSTELDPGALATDPGALATEPGALATEPGALATEPGDPLRYSLSDGEERRP